MIKTAVIGASGYIGRHLLHVYRTEFPDCVGTSFTASDALLTPFDIRDPDVARLRLIELGHQAVLLAAAKSNVGWCEGNAQDSYDINVRGTLECARQIGKLGLSVIFLSSDYVFDGKCAPYRDIDEPRPSTEYGYQKARVESALPQFVDDFLILRLSKVYGIKKGDATLLDQMARLLSKGMPVQAAYDQKFCPTYINDIIEVLRGLQAAKELRGNAPLQPARPFTLRDRKRFGGRYEG